MLIFLLENNGDSVSLKMKIDLIFDSFLKNDLVVKGLISHFI